MKKKKKKKRICLNVNQLLNHFNMFLSILFVVFMTNNLSYENHVAIDTFTKFKWSILSKTKIVDNFIKLIEKQPSGQTKYCMLQNSALTMIWLR